MDLELRPVTGEEYPAFSRSIERAFGTAATDEEVESWRGVTEMDRTLAVFDRGQVVGTAGAFSFDMTLPGLATIPVAAVTAVSVATTHRRRGILRQMMERQLDDVVARDEPVAILTASESGIYGRFGYGLATFQVYYEVEKDHSAFRAPLAADGEVQIVDPATAAKVCPEVGDRARRMYPGQHSEPQARWDLYFSDPQRWRDGASGRFYAIYESAGGVDGWVAYRQKGDWEGGVARGAVIASDLVTTTDDAYAALCRFLLDVDLKTTVRLEHRRIDEPLRWLLDDPRRLRTTTVMDDVWVRLLDIPASLAARTYGTADGLVVEVSDPFRPANDGRYAIEGGPDGATCSATTATADLALGVAELGSIYLGGVAPSSLARAGRVDELAPGALRRADAFFASDIAPWSQNGF